MFGRRSCNRLARPMCGITNKIFDCAFIRNRTGYLLNWLRELKKKFESVVSKHRVNVKTSPNRPTERLRRVVCPRGITKDDRPRTCPAEFVLSSRKTDVFFVFFFSSFFLSTFHRQIFYAVRRVLRGINGVLNALHRYGCKINMKSDIREK